MSEAASGVDDVTRGRRRNPPKGEQEPEPVDKEFRGVKLSAIRRSLIEVQERGAQVLARIGAWPSCVLPTWDEGYGDLQPVWLDYKIPETQYPRWKESGFFPICPPGSKSTPHPTLGAGRCIAELGMLYHVCLHAKELGRPLHLVDIGSNAMRLRAALAYNGLEEWFSHIHHVIPVIQPADKRRLALAQARFSTCQCRAQECVHLDEADVLTMQHSVYYFHPDELIAIIGPRKLYATLHLIDDACGELENRQMVWYVGEDGFAHCQAEGNPSAYVHPMNAWMRAGMYVSGGKTLVWEKLDSRFSSHIYEFSVVDGELSQPESHEDQDETQLAALNGQIQAVYADFSSHDGGDLRDFVVQRVSLRWGLPLVYAWGSNKTLTLPRDLVGTLSLTLAGLPRNSMTFGVAMDRARRFFIKSNYPRELGDKIVTMAVCMAMVRGVENNTAQVGRMNHLYGPLFEIHNQVMAGGEVKTWRWYHYFWTLNPKNWWQGCCGDEHHSDEAKTYVDVRSSGVTPRVTDPLHLGDQTRLYPVYEWKSKELPKLRKGAKVTQVDNVNTGDARQPFVRLSLIGLGGSPTTSRRGADELTQGMKVRLAREVPEPEEWVWPSLTAKTKDPGSVLYKLNQGAKNGGKARGSKKLFNEWVSRYTIVDRAKFNKAWENVQANGYQARFSKTSCHIKIEKQAMSWPDTSAVLDPRIIQSYSPEHTATCGPLHWVTAELMRLDFSQYETAVWVNGDNASLDGFGEAWKNAVDSTPGGWTYYGDQSKFEAHWSEGRFAFHRSVADEQVEDPLFFQFLDNEDVLVGTSVDKSIKYRIPWILGSGNSKTTKVNGEANLASLVHTFGEPKEGHLYFFFNGDDWLVRAREEISVDEIKSRMLQCGFETSAMVTQKETDVEFCQLIPYPTDNGTRVVWGPKIGRVLSRLPWRSNSNHDDDPRGIALGMRVSVAHIPFLKEYIDRVIKLSPRVKAVQSEYKTYASVAYTYDASTLAFVQERYGLTEVDLEDFKFMLSSISSLSTIVEWPRLQYCAQVDE